MSTKTTSDVAPSTTSHLADQLAQKAHSAVDATRRRTNGALDSIDASVDQMHDYAPSAFSRAAAQMESMTRRARDASNAVRDSAHRAGDRAVGYIQHEPVKSVLIAVAAGAAVAMLAGWFARSRGGRL